MIDIALDGIQVFGRIFRPAHITGGEADYPPEAVANGYHGAPPVEVVQPSLLALLQQAHLRHQLDGQAGCLGELQQVVPAVGRVADAHLFGVGLAPPAFDIVGGYFVGRIQQVRPEVLGAPLVDNVHAVALHALLFLFRCQLRLFNLDAVPLTQGSDGLGESKRVVLHQESDDVATLSAPEAMPGSACWVHHEAGCLLLMQRAAGGIVRPFLLQLDVTADDIDDVGAVEDLFNNSFVYHSCISLAGITCVIVGLLRSPGHQSSSC